MSLQNTTGMLLAKRKEWMLSGWKYRCPLPGFRAEQLAAWLWSWMNLDLNTGSPLNIYLTSDNSACFSEWRYKMILVPCVDCCLLVLCAMFLPTPPIPVFSNVPMGAPNCKRERAWAPEDLEVESETTHSKHILPDCQKVHSPGECLCPQKDTYRNGASDAIHRIHKLEINKMHVNSKISKWSNSMWAQKIADQCYP